MSKKYRERLAASSGLVCSRAFESDFGKRILKKYGWREGEGLGRHGRGRTDCIQAKRREDKQGLGAEKRKQEDNWGNWWQDYYNSVAQKVSVTATPAEAADSSDSSSDEGSEAKAPDGGRVTAVKQAGAMRGKLRRVLRQELVR